MNCLGGSGHKLTLPPPPFICLCRGHGGSGLKWKLRLGHTGIEDLGHCVLGGGNICREEASLGLAERSVLAIQIFVSGAPPSGAFGNWSNFPYLGRQKESPKEELKSGIRGLWLLTLSSQNKDKVGRAAASAN